MRALLPTGNSRDRVDGVEVTCIDNGMPVILLRAEDLGVSGQESCEALDGDDALKARLESIRLQMGPRMNLGDVSQRNVPKMCLVSAPRHGGTISTRSFIPHRCHASIGVFGAVSAATACLIEGTVTQGIAVIGTEEHQRLSVEHPSGEFSIEVTLQQGALIGCGLVRTARLLFDGQVCVPRGLWSAGVKGPQRGPVLLQSPHPARMNSATVTVTVVAITAQQQVIADIAVSSPITQSLTHVARLRLYPLTKYGNSHGRGPQPSKAIPWQSIPFCSASSVRSLPSTNACSCAASQRKR